MSGPDNPLPCLLMVISGGVSAPTVYSLAEAARIAGVHPERLRYYCQRGLFGADLARAETEPVFDDDQLYEVRRFEHFRRHRGVSPETLRLLCDLWREVEDLKIELRFLRGR